MSRRLAAVLAALAAGFVLRSALRPLPLRSRPGFSRAVYDRKGRLLRLTLSPDGKYRLWLPLSEVSPKLVEATLLQEDRRFHFHPGADPASLLQAAWTTYGSRGRRRGGSTITMQLARLEYGMDSSRARGKLLQILRAFQLELFYSKDDILEAYLNLLPYGGNVEGAGAASLIYFDKDASRLDLSEALTLAVIPQNPIRRALSGAQAPGDAAREAARRRLFARWIARHPDDARGGGLLEAPWRVRGTRELPFLAPHFVARALSASGAESLTTTLDLDSQRLVERLIAGYVARRKDQGIRNAAALLVDFTTMEVEAAVGSADFRDEDIQGQVSALTAKRSPGSTLKPFVYGLAYEQGLIQPLSLLKDAPATFGAYDPENFDGEFAGPLPAREALIKSRNIPAVALDAQLKAPGLYGFLKDAGVDLPEPSEHYGLGLALGAGEVTMEDLARLYALLGNSGELKPLRRLLAEPRIAGRRLLSPEATFLVMDSLKDNPRPHQNFRADWRADDSAVYWKTGTSWAFRDAWSAGVFGRRVLIVWIGDFRGRGNPAFVGADAAAPLFFEIADALNARAPEPDAYARAQTGLRVVPVEVCALSGALPGPGCRHRVKTWFIPGVSPIATCDVHRQIQVDAGTGLRTCRRENARTVTAEFWSSDLLRLFELAGLPRRRPPADDASCGLTSRSGRGLPPKITSPLAGAAYRAAAADPGVIALTAVADADVRTLWWFADGALLGRSAPGRPFFWTPRPGRSTVRVVDDQGRADARDVEVDFED